MRSNRCCRTRGRRPWSFWVLHGPRSASRRWPVSSTCTRRLPRGCWARWPNEGWSGATGPGTGSVPGWRDWRSTRSPTLASSRSRVRSCATWHQPPARWPTSPCRWVARCCTSNMSRPHGGPPRSPGSGYGGARCTARPAARSSPRTARSPTSTRPCGRHCPSGPAARSVTPSSSGELLPSVRRQGYATSVDELEDGMSSVAVPVLAPEGSVLAAIGVAGPSARLTEARLKTVSVSARSAAGVLTRRATPLLAQGIERAAPDNDEYAS